MAGQRRVDPLRSIRWPDVPAQFRPRAYHFRLARRGAPRRGGLGRCFEPLYSIRPDNSHKVSAGGESDPGGLGRYSRIEEMQQAPEKVAILSGDPRSPYIRIDPYFMDPPAEPRARQALSALIEAIDRELRDLVLESGDVCFIDNFKAVHGRRAFRARYDGRDRWLKRINITRDMRKSRAWRTTATSRVIQ